MFIFSLHCEGDKQCWPRQCHADTRKRLLSLEVVSSNVEVVTGQERGRLVRVSFVGVVLDFLGRQKGSSADEFLLRHVSAGAIEREPEQSCKSCVAGPLCSTDLVTEGSYSLSDGKQQLPKS